MKLGRETKGNPVTDLLLCFPSHSHIASIQNSNKLHNHHRRHYWRRKPATMGSEIPEPSSPKVTCAGQIKIMKPKNGKSWQSVMEEIERIHNRKKLQTRRFNWVEFFGLMQFDFRCLREFPEADEEEEEEGIESSRTAFSKWFMVLHEMGSGFAGEGSIEPPPPTAAPPENALLLMRCRSAPAKSLLEVKVKKSLKWLMEEENRDQSLVTDLFSSWEV